MIMNSLKSKMVVATLLLSACILLITAFLTLWYFEGQFKEMISEQTFTLVTAQARAIDDKIENAHNMLIAVSRVMPIDILHDPERSQQWLSNRSGIRFIFDNGVFIWSKTGRLIVEDPFIPGRRGMDFSDAEYIRETLATGKPVISQAHISRKEHHHPIIVMTSPVFDKNGKLAGILAGSLDLMKENFLSSVAQIKVGKTGYVYLFNHDRMTIIHPDKERILKKDVPPGVNKMYDWAVNGFEGSGETVNSRGLHTLMSVKHLLTKDWILAANYPVSEAYAPIKKARFYFFIILGAALFLTVLIVWFAMKRLTSPLLIFTKHVEELPSRAADARLIVLNTGDEIGRLAGAFNAMIAELDQQHEAHRASEERYRSFIESSLDGVYFSDKIGIFRQINTAGAQILGHASPDKIIGKPVAAYWSDQAQRERFVDRLKTCKSVKAFEIRGRKADGTEIYLEATSRLVENDAGEFFGIEGILRDTTDRVQAKRQLEEKNRELELAYQELRSSQQRLEQSAQEVNKAYGDLKKEIAVRQTAEEKNAKLYHFTRTVLDSMTDAISVIDTATFRITDVNEAFLREAGMSRDNVIGRTCYEITHNRTAACEPPDDGCPVPGCLASGKQVTVEHIHHTKGKTVFVEVTVAPIRERSGEITQLLHIARDITDRKKAEVELTAKHEELRVLFNKVSAAKKEWDSTIDATSDILVLLDSAGAIKRCNRSFRDLTGKAYEKLLGTKWEQTATESGLLVSTLHKEKSEFFHEASNRWFESSAYVFKDVDGGEKLVITMHDVTEVKKVTRALELTNIEIESRRAKFETALDQISHLIQEVTMKKDFSVRFSNPDIRHCWEVMQCGRQECPSYRNTRNRRWQIEGTFCGGNVQGGFAHKFFNCTECPTYKIATIDPIYQIGENFNNMMHILETQHGELEHAYNNLKLAQSQITQQEKMASIGQLAAGVAHEINNPTGFIMSNLGSLQKFVEKLTEFLRIEGDAVTGLPPERIAEVLQQRKVLKVDYILDDIHGLIRESLDGADRIKKIVQDLKSFSRVDEAEQKMADINGGIESTINIVWNELKYKATVAKEYGDIPQTKCNPGQLNQVFMNILVNAAHAIEKQGEIRIRTWSVNGTINISISDNGKGIPKDNINRIFEPFFTTKEVGQGTGLGLSIAYDIVKKHKGTIEVESEVGKGTTFLVTIPVAAG